MSDLKEATILDTTATRLENIIQDLAQNINTLEQFSERLERPDAPVNQEGGTAVKEPEPIDMLSRFERIINNLGWQTERTAELKRKLDKIS